MSETPFDPSELDRHRDRFRERLGALKSLTELKALADEYLSRKSGVVTGWMGKLREVSKDAKREVGARINEFKNEVETAIASKREALEATQLPAGSVDVTLPGRPLPLGR